MVYFVVTGAFVLRWNTCAWNSREFRGWVKFRRFKNGRNVSQRRRKRAPLNGTLSGTLDVAGGAGGAGNDGAVPPLVGVAARACLGAPGAASEALPFLARPLLAHFSRRQCLSLRCCRAAGEGESRCLSLRSRCRSLPKADAFCPRCCSLRQRDTPGGGGRDGPTNCYLATTFSSTHQKIAGCICCGGCSAKAAARACQRECHLRQRHSDHEHLGHDGRKVVDLMIGAITIDC